MKLIYSQYRGKGSYSSYFLVPKKIRVKANHGPQTVEHLHLSHKIQYDYTGCPYPIPEWTRLVCDSWSQTHISMSLYTCPTGYFCAFSGQGSLQYKIHPFGLSTMPRIFMKLIAMVAILTHKFSYHIFPYLNDWLLKDWSYPYFDPFMSRSGQIYDCYLLKQGERTEVHTTIEGNSPTVKLMHPAQHHSLPGTSSRNHEFSGRPAQQAYQQGLWAGEMVQQVFQQLEYPSRQGPLWQSRKLEMLSLLLSQ